MKTRKSAKVKIVLFGLHASAIYLVIIRSRMAAPVNLVGFVAGVCAFKSFLIAITSLIVANTVKNSYVLSSIPLIGSVLLGGQPFIKGLKDKISGIISVDASGVCASEAEVPCSIDKDRMVLVNTRKGNWLKSIKSMLSVYDKKEENKKLPLADDKAERWSDTSNPSLDSKEAIVFRKTSPSKIVDKIPDIKKESGFFGNIWLKNTPMHLISNEADTEEEISREGEAESSSDFHYSSPVSSDEHVRCVYAGYVSESNSTEGTA